MNDQLNLDIWTYSRERRPLDFLKFATDNGAKIPDCKPRNDTVNIGLTVESFYDFKIENE
jgi:hypothetical protein